MLVVGAGKVGSEISRDLALSPEVDSVTSADANRGNLKQAKRSNSKIRTLVLDISQKKRVDAALRNVDLVCGALPGRLGFQLMKRAANVGRNLVDISYTPENPFQLDSEARRNDSIIVPQCGVAPGFSNMCVGDASRTLGRLDSVRIFVGGLPQKPEPPLNYRVVFSLEDVINEYSRPVNVIENSRRKLVNPLTGRGVMTFPGVGRLEYFLTDGLGSLPHSFPRTRKMYELTLRYPGHADMMETLRVLGFFSQTVVGVNGVQVAPRKVSLELLRPEMSKGRPEDLLALRVNVFGNGSLVTYEVLDFYDRKNRVSAMARTTAYPCTSVALLVGRGRLHQTGIVTPEKIAKDRNHFDFIVSRLRQHGIKLKTRRKPLRSR
ncbi:MAG TPA: saccharopine dehydrogenase C-terminal domain-containing protein [Candidatus Bathyarchaeia archaeon]|nr:saccharopine dehydrogenase C-terminal domain-containing protein [Candidatus Bathyarchaeia archaeon]